MRRIRRLAAAACALVLAAGCGTSPPDDGGTGVQDVDTWDEQYDRNKERAQQDQDSELRQEGY